MGKHNILYNRQKPTPPFGAGEGNRTLVVSLEGFCSTIELHPHYYIFLNLARKRNLISPGRLSPNLHFISMIVHLVEEEGIEPSKAEPSDLQSDPFDRSGTPPNETADYECIVPISQSVF